MRLDTIFRVATKLDHSIYSGVRPIRPLPRRLRTGRWLPGRRHCGRIDHPLFAIIFGLSVPHSALSRSGSSRLLVPAGVLIYSVTGAVSFIYGLNYMDYAALAHDSKHGHHLGILLVETGVIVTVASTMTAIFYAFVERGR